MESMTKRLAIITASILLAAPLAAQEPATDSVTANAALTLMLPAGTFTVQGDTTLVENALTLNINISDLTADQRQQMATAAGQAVPQSHGVPTWVYIGGLAIAAGWALAYHLKGSTEYTFINEQGQTVTVNHPCWPRSYGKGKPPQKCEDE